MKSNELAKTYITSIFLARWVLVIKGMPWHQYFYESQSMHVTLSVKHKLEEPCSI